MRISDWSSDVCSSDLSIRSAATPRRSSSSPTRPVLPAMAFPIANSVKRLNAPTLQSAPTIITARARPISFASTRACARSKRFATRSEEHTSELQSLMRISYAVFCLKKKQTRPDNLAQLNTSTHTSQHRPAATEHYHQTQQLI